MQSSSESSTRQKATVPAGPKLRDSCHGCAASKLRCSKEKPTCARCAKRGVVCEYFATRRAGRKQGSRSNNAPTMTQPLPTPGQPAIAAPDTLASPGIASPLPHHQPSSYPDLLPDLLSSSGPTTVSTPGALSAHFDDFFASPMSFAMLDPGDGSALTDPTGSSLLDPGLINSHLLSEDALSAIEQAVCELPSYSKPQTPPHSRPPTTRGFREDTPCTCLTRVLGLLGSLFPHGSGSCQSSQIIHADPGHSPLPTLQSVIADNEKILDAISSMLPCPCSHDGYLLSLMSLIVFKVMGWYAAASRHTPSSSSFSTRDSSRGSGNLHEISGLGHYRHPPEQVQHSPAVVGSYCVDGSEQGRMAAQLVLSELHRVQRLVNVLSQRLKGHITRAGGSHSGSSADGSGGVGPGTPSGSSVDGSDAFSARDRDLTFPFPPTVLQQLEVDLRRRLRGLSAEIVDMLRRG